MADEHSYVWFQMRTHHGLFDSVLEKDEEKDADRHLDLAKDKLTFTECVVALALALTFVSLHAVFLGTSFFIWALLLLSFPVEDVDLRSLC